jgi:predicted DNA-binding transcriptional regulator AlpA
MARPKTIISKAELAAVLGLSRARITQLSKRKDFPSRSDGRVNRERAVKWYHDAGLAEQFRKRGPKPRHPAVAKSTLVAERVMAVPADSSSGSSRSDLEAALLKERIKKERLSNDAREHSLVDLGKVNAFVCGMITRAAGILDRIPAELGDRLAQISNPIECQKLLKAELDRARHELAVFRP